MAEGHEDLSKSHSCAFIDNDMADAARLLLPQSFRSSALVTVYVGFLWVLHFPPTSLKHAYRWIDLNACPWCPVYSHLFSCDIIATPNKAVTEAF